jgi:hypothetical protein
MAVTPVNLNPDPVAETLAPNGVLKEPSVSFRGYLAPADGDTHRFFISGNLDHWLEIKTADILFRMAAATAGDQALTSDGASVIFVRRRAQINSCHTAEACEIAAEHDAAMDDDPTDPYPTATRPKRPY